MCWGQGWGWGTGGKVIRSWGWGLGLRLGLVWSSEHLPLTADHEDRLEHGLAARTALVLRVGLVRVLGVARASRRAPAPLLLLLLRLLRRLLRLLRRPPLPRLLANPRATRLDRVVILLLLLVVLGARARTLVDHFGSATPRVPSAHLHLLLLNNLS